MNITPDQARKLLDGATPGPWYEDGSNIMNHDGDPLLSDGSFGDPNWYNVRDLTLMAAAPDLAQTIAVMQWEYAVEMMGEEWEMVGLYGPDEPWGSEADARGAMKAWRSPRPTRLVRRLVGPVEVIDGE